MSIDFVLIVPYTIGYRLLTITINMKTLTTNKAKTLKYARQIQGTLNKIIEMVEEDRYCHEIIQQVDSVIGLLKTAKRELLAGHLDTCVAHQMKENKKKTINELVKIFNLSN